MSLSTLPSPAPAILPDSAPFTPQQRAWLNGFFAAWIGIAEPTSDPASGGGGSDGDRGSDSGSDSGSGGGNIAEAQPAEDFPWHQPEIALDERLQLAADRPWEQRLMSAMAQLDCGACGYLCQTYAASIASGDERSLNLCAPGGKPTLQALKRLLREREGESPAAQNGSGAGRSGAARGENGAAVPANGSPAPHRGPSANGPSANGPSKNGPSKNGPSANGHSANGHSANGHSANGHAANGHAANNPSANGRQHDRDRPFAARLKSRRALNREGSAKSTTHVELDLAGSGIAYEPGDALGVWPANCEALVDAILQHVTEPTAAVEGPRETQTLSAALRSQFDLRSADGLLEFAAQHAPAASARAAAAALVDGIVELQDDLDVLDVLEQFLPSIDAADLVEALTPLRPRLYSISSSLRAHPAEVHLTVGRVESESRSRIRKGVASTMFADRLALDEKVPVYVHASPGFRLPAAAEAPIIMVGPGTGVAPFRAFLQERRALAAPGPNWLLFGDQCRGTDFLYQEELESHLKDGLLTRLDTAFSRDQPQKIYVQHRILENGKEIYRWLMDGASIYVCGDARRMAADVDRALHDVVARHRGSSEAAREWILQLKAEGRYARDVY